MSVATSLATKDIWTDFNEISSNFAQIWSASSDTLCFLNFLPLIIVVALVTLDFFTGTGSCGNQGIEVIKESPTTVLVFLLAPLTEETVIADQKQSQPQVGSSG